MFWEIKYPLHFCGFFYHQNISLFLTFPLLKVSINVIGKLKNSLKGGDTMNSNRKEYGFQPLLFLCYWRLVGAGLGFLFAPRTEWRHVKK